MAVMVIKSIFRALGRMIKGFGRVCWFTSREHNLVRLANKVIALG